MLEAIGQAVLERRDYDCWESSAVRTPPGPPLLRGGKEKSPGPARQRPSPARRGDGHLPRSRAAHPCGEPTAAFPPLPFPPLRRGGQGGWPSGSPPHLRRNKHFPPLEKGGPGGVSRRKPDPIFVATTTSPPLEGGARGVSPSGSPRHLRRTNTFPPLRRGGQGG